MSKSKLIPVNVVYVDTHGKQGVSSHKLEGPVGSKQYFDGLAELRELYTADGTTAMVMESRHTVLRMLDANLTILNTHEAEVASGNG